jgi:competence protein ComEC
MNLWSWQYRRFHISYLLGWLAVGVLVGLIAGKLLPVASSWVWLIAGLVLLPGVLKTRRWWSVGVIVIAGLCIGWQRGSNESLSLQNYAHWFHQTSVVRGIIMDDPQYGKHGDQQMRLGDITVNDVPMRGSLFVSTTSYLDIKRDDAISLRGKLDEGFGSYAATLRYGEITNATDGSTPIRELRGSFAAGVRNGVPEPEASLGVGFVVGQRSALPDDLDEQLKIVGLTHIVVASGYNLTILVRFARRIFAKHSRYLAMVTSLGLVGTFIALSGMTPSMVRAGAVTVLSLLAWYFGRRFHPLLLILFVAGVTAYWNPTYVWADIGWYLSFLAFFGVLILSPLIVARLYGDRTPPAIVQMVIETIAAELMTLPLILLVFERVPVFALLANVLVGPTIPFAMLASAVAGIAGMIMPAFAGLFAVPATIVVGYTVAVVEILSSVSWAQVVTQVSPVVFGVFYLLLLGTVAVWWRKLGKTFQARSIVE